MKHRKPPSHRLRSGQRVPDDIRARGRLGEGAAVVPLRGSVPGPGAPLARPGSVAGVASFNLFPPDIYPPPGAQHFTAEGTLSGATIATTTAPGAVLASFQIPPNEVAVVRDVTLSINSMLASTDVRWRLRFNGSLVSGWNDLTIFPRAAASVVATFPPESTLIEVPDGALTEMLVQVVDAGTYFVGATFHGWHYGKSVKTRYASVWNAG